jgi:repressor LexA
MKNLSDRQMRIVEFIRAYVADNGYPPTFREIGLSVGLKSPSTVDHHMKRLREMGILQYEEGHFRSISLAEDREEAPPPGTVPLVGRVAAGAPILAEECVEEYIPFDPGSHPEDCFALRVRGESMLNAGILPDDLVIVRRQPEAYNGEIVVALFEDEATVKTLSRKNGQVWLLPENPDYEPIDGTQCQIIGKVVGLVRRY